jgi:hypothetical protein
MSIQSFTCGHRVKVQDHSPAIYRFGQKCNACIQQDQAIVKKMPSTHMGHYYGPSPTSEELGLHKPRVLMVPPDYEDIAREILSEGSNG